MVRAVQLAGTVHILPLQPVGKGPPLVGPQIPCPEQQDPPQSCSAAHSQGETSVPAAVAVFALAACLGLCGVITPALPRRQHRN